MSMPLGPVIVHSQVARREMLSALPDAPTVLESPLPAKPVLRRTRRVTAGALHRAAHRIAPA